MQLPQVFHRPAYLTDSWYKFTATLRFCMYVALPPETYSLDHAIYARSATRAGVAARAQLAQQRTALHFHTMTDDRAPAVFASRSQSVNRTLKAVESMPRAGCRDFETLIVVIPANFTLRHEFTSRPTITHCPAMTVFRNQQCLWKRPLSVRLIPKAAQNIAAVLEVVAVGREHLQGDRAVVAARLSARMATRQIDVAGAERKVRVLVPPLLSCRCT